MPQVSSNGQGIHSNIWYDYFENFFLVACLSFIHILVTITINLDWPLNQLDVNNTFLYGDISKEVYIVILPIRKSNSKVTNGHALVCFQCREKRSLSLIMANMQIEKSRGIGTGNISTRNHFYGNDNIALVTGGKPYGIM